MKIRHPVAVLSVVLVCFLCATLAAVEEEVDVEGSIVFATLGRARYAFDIYTHPIINPQTPPNQNREFKLTDGNSVNYNGFFSNLTLHPSSLQLLYVTERQGTCDIYLDDGVYYDDAATPGRLRRSIRQKEEEVPNRVQIPLLSSLPKHNTNPLSNAALKDRPSISGDYLVYVSTHENPGLPRKSWAAVYSSHLITGETRRLTPHEVADYSPSVSPSGIWTAVASHGERGWNGEIEDLYADLYIFKTHDGLDRAKVVEHGGWPCWTDDYTIYFHRKSDDGWWSVYRAILPRQGPIQAKSVVIERITPPGVHAFTPATSAGNKNFIAVATRRPTSDFRHIELFHLVEKKFVEITKPISPRNHHYNPFITPDGSHIGYHRCRGSGNGGESDSPLLFENIKNPVPEVSLFRIDGSFPSFSPDGDRIAYAGFPGLYVVNRNGSGKREVFPGTAFATAWDWKRKGVVYTSVGPTFATERTEVDIISVDIDEGTGEPGSGYSYKKLTTGGQNNAFPSASPDGKWVVFRSGRSGHKNLYIMDAIMGEKGALERLTEGPWTDTMCNWSPDGEWIAFASDRDNPGSGSFAIYLIHPNGTGLRKVLHSGEGGRTNHPWFSPDSKSLVFTSDYAAVSAEPIGNPHHFQPYGDIFVARADGSDIRRLTHNSYEDGTPTWGPTFMNPVNVAEFPFSETACKFDDCHWLSKVPKNQVMALPNPRCGGVGDN